MRSYKAVIVAAAILTSGTAAMAQQAAGDGMSSKTDQPADVKGQKTDPGTAGAMSNSASGIATSPEDVQRQTEGKPTMSDEAMSGKKSDSTNPGMTQNSPGTVGAAPGTTPPASDKVK